MNGMKGYRFGECDWIKNGLCVVLSFNCGGDCMGREEVNGVMGFEDEKY